MVTNSIKTSKKWSTSKTKNLKKKKIIPKVLRSPLEEFLSGQIRDNLAINKDITIINLNMSHSLNL